MNGEMVEAVGEPEKTGWAYVVNQENCKPVYPIPEVKVPQDPAQNTWPTQPEPTMEPFSPVEATPEAVEKAEEAVASYEAETEDHRQRKRSPRRARTRPDQPRRELGGRWRQLAAVLLRPGKEHVLRLLAVRRARPRRPAEPQKYVEGETYIGSDTIVATGFDTTGYLTAYDMSTGKIKWQNEIPKNRATPVR